MHFLYPSDPLRRTRPDPMYAAEVAAAREVGIGVSFFPLEELQSGTFDPYPSLPAATILYRGWMLGSDEYDALVSAVRAAGAGPFADRTAYTSTHHLPNWYARIADLTPETRIFPVGADLASELRSLDWPAYFIKDYVKSLKTSIGSLIATPEQAAIVASEMEKFRGHIEGGFCVRRVEDFLPETEQRYFVVDSLPHSASGPVPPIVSECARRIDSRFYSVDVIRRTDGVLRIVEVGDGQVSDLVGWTPHQFISIFEGVPDDAPPKTGATE